MQMRNRFQTPALIVLAACSIAITACGGGHDANRNAGTAAGDVSATPGATPVASTPVVRDTAPAAHHSKLGGALAGAAVGHMLGGHAVAGAAVGAIVQHERNKHAHQ